MRQRGRHCLPKDTLAVVDSCHMLDGGKFIKNQFGVILWSPIVERVFCWQKASPAIIILRFKLNGKLMKLLTHFSFFCRHKYPFLSAPGCYHLYTSAGPIIPTAEGGRAHYCLSQQSISQLNLE